MFMGNRDHMTQTVKIAAAGIFDRKGDFGGVNY